MHIRKFAVLPKGFKANGVYAGIKKSKKPDLAVFYSRSAARASGLFTTNKIIAAPILISKQRLSSNRQCQAIVVNSGNANCFNGAVGLKDAESMAFYAAKSLGIPVNNVLVASTGIIGKKLPIEKIKNAMPFLIKDLSRKNMDKAKLAIMTTDTFSKEISVKFKINNRQVSICGVVKGSGMISPKMATLLCFIFTDACITQAALDKALSDAVRDSFNCITIDGCMSTNDSLIILANAQANNKLISAGASFAAFSKALNVVCLELAKMVVKDGEGATKFIKIKVSGARNSEQAKRAALFIANSDLFKTAMFAASSNIRGRIVASVGASGVEVNDRVLGIKYTPLKKKQVEINVSLGIARSDAVVYTSDLSYEYIRINAQYN